MAGLDCYIKTWISEIVHNSFAFLNTSDSHRIEDFELNTTWIKMSKPCLDGIRQIVYEPELRLAHKIIETTKPFMYPRSLHFESQPEIHDHNFIIGLAVSGGMLENLLIAFSPHMNSIIGRNYAGKSALLDCLRFGLNAIPSLNEGDSHEAPYFKFVNRLKAILGNGGQVRIYTSVSGKVYCIYRTLTCSKISGVGSKEKWKIDGGPEINLLWNNEFHKETDITLEDQLFIPEAYPQGEVVKIKDNVNQQMKIVDALANTKDLYLNLTLDEISGEKTLLGELNGNSERIIKSTERRDELSAHIGSIDQLESEILELETLVASDQYEELKNWGKAKNEISNIQGKLSTLKLDWNNIRINESSGDTTRKLEGGDFTALDISSASPEQFTNFVVAKYQQLLELLGESKKQVNNQIDGLIELLTEIENRRQSREVDAKNKLTIESGEEVGVSLLERIREKREKLDDKKRKQQEFNDLGKQLSDYRKKRDELIRRFKEGWELIRNKRKEVVEMITLNSPDNINVRLLEGVENSDYRKLLDEISDHVTSASSRIQNRSAQLELIVEMTSPEKLLELVSNGNIDELMNLVPGLTQNTARLFISMGLPDQLSLEQCITADELEISFRKEGECNFTPISNGLSGGEQALALISVAMVPKGTPLIIDQPEDELGPALITKDLVDQIRNVKTNRQLIFVTHVPNIPVLADSEQIIYMAQEFYNGEKRINAKHHGSLDDREIIAKLLEIDGGEDAFMKRSERYAPLLGNRQS